MAAEETTRARRRRRRPVASETEVAPGVIVETSATDDPEWQALYGRMLAESLCFFAKEILGLVIAPHMLEWEEMIAEWRRIAILAARDHGKSTFWTYAFPIWRTVMEPGCEVFLFAKTVDQAREYLDIILNGKPGSENADGSFTPGLKGMRDIPCLAHLVPEEGTRKRSAGEKATQTDVRLKNGSRIRVVGFGKKVRGAHPKYVVCDDVLNDEDMYSETVRKKNIDYFKGAITQMVPPSGQLIVVGTPFHMSDLYGWLRTNKRYKFAKYPGIVKKGAKECALFPWRWSLEALYAKREEIGPIAFAREVLCEPVTDDLSIFPSHLFPPLYNKEMTLRPKYSYIKAQGWTTYMGVDIALSANVGADYFVIFTIARDKLGNHYIIDIERTKGLSFRRQLEAITSSARRYKPSLIFIEANLFQKVYSDEMKRTSDLPVKPFITTAQNKYPLDKGVPSLRILLENEKLVIPYNEGDNYTVEQINTWVAECTQFGFVDGKLQGIGEHDDTVMAWWLAEEAMKAGGFSFAMGDGEETGDDAMDEEVDDDEWKREMGLLDEDDDEDEADDADEEDGAFAE